MNRALKYVTGALGLWLIVVVSVFGSGAALWIAFGTAIAIALAAATDFVVSIGLQAVLARAAAAATGPWPSSSSWPRSSSREPR